LAINMRAIRYTKYGPPDVLSEHSVPRPSAGPNEVLLKLRYSTVNRTDCGFLRGKPHIVRLFSQILGCEFSGDVIELGEGVTDYKIGDRVFGFKDDDFGFGGHAQYTAMNCAGLLHTIPDSVDYKQAAAALEGAHYALFYIRAAGVNDNSRVLVNGGTGAIGSAAVQLLKALGAHVTAVCGGEHAQKVAALGADRVLDYHTEDFTQLDEQFDYVFDAVGKSRFKLCKRILKPNGVYSSSELGPYCENPFLALLTSKSRKQRVLFPIPKNETADAKYIASLLENGRFKPLIDRTYQWEDAVDAFHYVETGEKIGNVLLEIKHDQTC